MPLWDFLEQYWPRFMTGIVITSEQFLLASALTIAISLLFGLMTLSNSRTVRWAAVAYIEFFRGTSLLVQIYWIFFVLPLFGFTLPAFTAGFLAVAMNSGAYGAEMVRGGIQSVAKGQWEAAYALSMSSAKRMRRIILPQAFVIMLPTIGNLFIDVLKGTALTSLIAVTDLMFQAKQINNITFLSAQTFGTALIVYYIFARFLLTPATSGLEAKLRRKLSRS